MSCIKVYKSSQLYAKRYRLFPSRFQIYSTSEKTCKRKINCTEETEYNANSFRTYTNVHEYPAKREGSVDLSTRREDPRVSGQMVGQPLIASACRVCKHSEVFTRVRAYAWPAPRISRSSGGLVSRHSVWSPRIIISDRVASLECYCFAASDFLPATSSPSSRISDYD